ncbi:TPA: ParB/RepB/Spo0J family partition protein [Clostridioides difficile]|nr:ParB/RepB/Spo0J family partition protein [Clostridioides difficile]
MNLIYKSFNTEQGDETFTDCIFIWNISKLLDYLKSSKKYLYKLNKVQYTNLITRGQSVDESKIELVNLDEPVIVIDYYRGNLLIDGIHRVRKAQKLNCEYIYAYVVPFEEHIKFLKNRTYFDLMIKLYNEFN